MKKLRDWQTVTIGEIADRVTVGIATSTTQHYRDRGVPILRNLNIRAGRLDDADLMFISEDFDNANQAKRLRANDVITVRTGFAGVSCVIPSKYEGAQTFTTLITSPRPELLNSSFMALHLNSDLGDREFYRLTGDAGRANLNAGALREYILDLPPLSEQRKIAEILGTWDEALEKLDALIQAEERRKKALMQQLLTGKVRVRGFSEPWQTKRFRDLLLAQDRYVGFDDEHTYNLVSIRRRSGGVFFREALKGSDIKTKVMKRVHQGDFVISRMQVVHGALGMVRPECDGMYGSDSYDVFVAKDPSQLHMPFLDWISRLRSFWNLAYICSHGVHIEKMTFNLEDFMHEKIVIPGEISEQQEIAAILDTCDEELRLLREEREALDQQKRGLMQRLLTGKVRVTV
jgi:type I restriction enzyme S subunit